MIQIGVDTQNEVVKEEKRQRYDAPYGKLLETIGENLFDKHPYHDSNIGKMEHLDAATLDEFNAFLTNIMVQIMPFLLLQETLKNQKPKK